MCKLSKVSRASYGYTSKTRGLALITFETLTMWSDNFLKGSQNEAKAKPVKFCVMHIFA